MNFLVSHIAYCTRVVGDFKRNITPMLKKNVDLRARRKSRNLRLRRITREKQIIFCVLANIVHGSNFLSFFPFSPVLFLYSQEQLHQNVGQTKWLVRHYFQSWCANFFAFLSVLVIFGIFSRPFKGWQARLKLRGARSNMNRSSVEPQ